MSSRRRYEIDVDAEVFEFLQNNASPLIDSPNDVLRRLLLQSKQTAKEGSPMVAPPIQPASVERAKANVDAFVGELIKRQFGAGFTRRSRYRLMFESSGILVYVQNFNKPSDHLWYRITEKPWKELQNSKKDAWLCFTNPTERYAYVLPVKEVVGRVSERSWARDYLEVNINAVDSRWVELDWNLESYLKQL